MRKIEYRAGTVFRILFLLLYLWLTGESLFVCAMEEQEKQGSITVWMRENGQAVPGGTLTLYSVENGSSTPERAKELELYVMEQHLSGREESADSEGKIYFDQLEAGSYLIIQKNSVEGYEKIVPFLVELPVEEGDTLLYEIQAEPKMERKNATVSKKGKEEKEESTKEKKKANTKTNVKEKEKSNKKENTKAQKEKNLPQTGQKKWPIPVLVCIGWMLFFVGWKLKKKNTKK